MRAYVLITVDVGKVRDVQRELDQKGRSLGVHHVAVVAGAYDLIAIVDAEEAQQVGGVVVDLIQAVPGVSRTVTLLELEHGDA